jgi:hypothetical protein
MLKDLYDKRGCDKGTKRHGYHRVYQPAFDECGGVFDMLEIGILKGNSIEAVLDYAPNCTIVGLDTFERIPPEKVPVLNHPNVGWAKCSSLDKPTQEFKEDFLPEQGFDIIIDDGLHTHDAQRITFENFFPLLNEHGVYYIEDVWAFDVMTEQERNHPWLRKHPNEWNNETYTKLLEAVSPYKVRHHDLRKGHQADSYIIEVRK